LDLTTSALRASFDGEQRHHEEAVSQLRAEWDWLQRRLDGKVDEVFTAACDFSGAMNKIAASEVLIAT
jgi:hypothetical protein